MCAGRGCRVFARSVRIKRVQRFELFCQLFSLRLSAEPAGSYIGVRSGALFFFGDSKMTDEDREIVFNTQVEHTPSEAVASGPGSSDSKMDAIMEALQSITTQNKGIELKIEQQDRKADVQVQEIS